MLKILKGGDNTDVKQIYDIMADNLKNLEDAAQSVDVGYENLADISLAMIQTAQFLVELSGKYFIPTNLPK